MTIENIKANLIKIYIFYLLAIQKQMVQIVFNWVCGGIFSYLYKM